MRGKSQPPEKSAAKPTLADSTSGPREVIEQAERDVGQGLVDTDRHGAPFNVPGPHRSQERRAEIPADGGNRASYSERRRSPNRDDERPGKK